MNLISKTRCQSIPGGSMQLPPILTSGLFFGMSTSGTFAALESNGIIDAKNPLHILASGTVLGFASTIPTLCLFSYLGSSWR